MGFLKKIGKGLRKAFKKIGQGIKKAFKKFGKFMGKIGILGQLAMMFILPGIGGALLKGFGSMAGNMASLTGRFAGLSGGALGTVVKGVGTVLKGAHGFVQAGVNAYKTVTSGIMEFGKTALNKIPGINISSAKANFFGKEGVFEGIKLDAKRIFDPFKSNITVGKGMTLESMSKTTGLSESTLQRLNPDMDFTNLKQGTNINLDFNQVSINKANIAGQVNNISNQAIAATGTAPNINDYNLNIDPEQVKNLNFDVGTIEPAGNQFSYTTTGQEFPMGGQYPIETVTTQTGTFNPQLGLEPTTIDTGSLLKPVGEIKTPSLLDDVSKMQTETVGFETEFGFPKPVEGQFNIDLTQQTKDAFSQSRFEGLGSGMESQSLLTPKDPSSFIGKVGQRITGGLRELPGKIGESFINTGVTALTDRAIYGSPEDPDYGPSRGSVEYAFPYQPVTEATPMADIGNIMAGFSPFGSSAAVNDAFSILNQNFGGSSYNYYIRGAAQ